MSKCLQYCLQRQDVCLHFWHSYAFFGLAKDFSSTLKKIFSWVRVYKIQVRLVPVCQSLKFLFYNYPSKNTSPNLQKILNKIKLKSSTSLSFLWRLGLAFFDRFILQYKNNAQSYLPESGLNFIGPTQKTIKYSKLVSQPLLLWK